MIGLFPPRLTWPSPILEGPFREIARANLTIVQQEGICLTNIHRLKPDREAVDDYASLLGTLQAFAHLVGGDFCAKVNNAKTDDGFKTDFVVQASLFDPNKVKVWPVINTVFERVVQLRLLRPLIEKVLPIVAGKNNMDEVEAMLVQAVTKLYPDPMSVDIDVGKLIAKGIELARKKIGGRRTRRLEGSEEGGSWISEEGMFDLGHIPPSDRLDGGFEGSGKACGWNCGTFKSDGTFGPPPPKPDYAISKNMTNITRGDGAQTPVLGTSTLIIVIVCSLVVLIGCVVSIWVSKKLIDKKKGTTNLNTKVTPANMKSKTKRPGAWSNEAWKD